MMSDNVTPIRPGGAGNTSVEEADAPIGPSAETRSQNVDEAKVTLSQANSVLELLIGLLDEHAGPLTAQALHDLEARLGVRGHTLVTSLYLVQQEIDRAKELLEHGRA